MHKKRLLIFREPEVFTILQRQLARKGYLVFPKVRLQDAIGKDGGEHLDGREFGYFTKAHFDFVVVRDYLPVFAVEFDGVGHQEPDAVERDVLKNRLCKAANLPLLRITAGEIENTRDQVTLLDYMLMRHVAWSEEIGGIMAEIAEWASDIPANADPEDLAMDLDPSFHFDLRHPFPGIAAVRERLWRQYRIAWEGDCRRQEERLVCAVKIRRFGNTQDDQFLTHLRTAAVWKPGPRPGDPVPPLFSQDVEVTLRAYLPLRTKIPPPPFFIDASQVLAVLEQARIRAEAMWMPWLPGVSVFDVAENYAEYRGLRSIEDWARKNLPSA